MKKWNSFAVNSPTDIVHHSSHALGGHPKANDADTKTRAIFVLAANTMLTGRVFDHRPYLISLVFSDVGILTPEGMQPALRLLFGIL